MLINIALYGTISNWSIVAGEGVNSFAFFLLAIIVFLIPLVLVSAELSSTWHRGGGSYMWVKEAFGPRAGFITVWLICLQNLTWLSLPLIWICYCLAYTFNVQWLDNSYYHLILSLIIIWITAFLSQKGTKFLKPLSNYGVIIGFFIPAATLIVLGGFWFFKGLPTVASFSLSNLGTDFTKASHWIIFPSLVFTFQGVEISAFHAKEVKNPKKTYPKAIFLSAILSIIITVFGSLAFAFFLPKEKILSFDSVTETILTLFKTFHISKLFPIFSFLLGLGIYVNFANWFSGPIRGLAKVAKHGNLPPAFHQVNKHNMPSTLIITQSVLMSILVALFILFPNIHTVYWFILAISAIWYLIAYLLIFAAAIKLRYKFPKLERPFKIPGGKLGMWCISGLGFVSCLVSLFFGFFLPQRAITLTTLNYALMIALAVVIICLCPWFILLFKKPSWKVDIEDEEE